MRYLSLILSFGFLYAQAPAQWWSQADSSQKAFAEKCYEFGKQYGRGHTLAAIAWMESSLGRDTNHKERSTGYFGISDRNRAFHDVAGTIQENSETDGMFEHDARLALWIFEDNISYSQRLGYSPREAYFWAYPRYNAGKNWNRFRKRGEVFQQRIRFLVRATQFK